MGEIAGLATGFLWAFTSIFFTIAGRKIGSMTVSRLRLTLAALILTGVHLFVEGSLLPLEAGGDRWFWLGLSALIGLAIGDALLFQALIWIGPRLSMLMMALAPVIGTVVAWVTLEEQLSLLELVAIALTIAGIVWVVLERRSSGTPAEQRQYGWGILAGLGAALCQALGLVTAKQGLYGDFSALSGVLIRMLVGSLLVWLWGLLRGQIGYTIEGMRNRSALAPMLGGTLTGPVFGVWLSLVAVQLAPVGIASALIALTPVFLLPLTRWTMKEPITWRAVLGTLLAIAGVILIFIR